MDKNETSAAFRRALRDRTRQLSDELDAIGPPPGIAAYNPLAYARAAHERYLELFGGPRRLLIVGMNPGPWGMVQTGVPFGNVETARTILGFGGSFDVDIVGQPAQALDIRPVQGFRCQRDEVSGRRFWSGLAPLWVKPGDDKIQPRPPGQFFGDAGMTAEQVAALQFDRQLVRMLGEVFVMNLCPLAFFDIAASAANVTPDKLPQPWRDRLVGDGSPCARYLVEIVALLRPAAVVVMGAWVERTVARWTDTRIVPLPHPSPANPAANKGWAPLAQAALRDAGVLTVE